MFQNRYKKWNKKIWIAKKIGTQENDYGYEMPVYAKPEMYMMNVQPISASADMQEFGERAKQMQKAVIELKKYYGKFNEFDVAYLDGASPLQDGGEIMASVKDIHSASTKEINNLLVKNMSNNKQEKYACIGANYRLYPPRNQNKCVVIYFERLTDK